MPGYKELYEYCQTLEPKISRNDILNKAIELTGVGTIKCTKTALDITKMRGFFLSVGNTQHSLVRVFGTNLIVLARGMNECWDRFITVKEVMHLFDRHNETTGTAEAFDRLLSDFELLKPAQGPSPQYSSELRSIWMALGCLCPEKLRLEFVDQFNKGHIDHYGIALKLKIPQQHVKYLLNDSFKPIIDTILVMP